MKNLAKTLIALIASIALTLGIVSLAMTLGVVSPAGAAEPLITYAAHVQSIGWMPAVSDGATAGTTGKALRMEAVRFSTSGQRARAHVQKIGWQSWESGAKTIGTTGKALRLEAVQVESTVPGQEILCRAHVQSIGWMPEVGDGEVCGTTGKALRMEAVQLRVVPSTPNNLLSTMTAVGDVGLETAGKNTLAGMGASNPDLVFLIGDLSYGTSAQPFCDEVAKSIDDPFGWVQGNHETVPDSDGPLTADFLACLPAAPNASGNPAIEEIIKIPGAWIITASPQEGYGYLPGSAALGRISAAIDAANAAGAWPILAFHEAHISVGMHGSAGPESKALTELAIAKGVPLVLNGHDHNYSRAVVGDTTIVVAGIGGHKPRSLDSSSPWWPQTVVAYSGPSGGGWLSLKISDNSISGELKAGSSRPDTFVITK